MDARAADPSSPIPAALTHLTQTDPRQLQDADAAHLLVYLAAVPDPRASRGRRHSLVAILAMAATAALFGLAFLRLRAIGQELARSAAAAATGPRQGRR